MTETINDKRIPGITPGASISVTPEGTTVGITADGTPYVWNRKYHAAGTALTFTASVNGFTDLGTTPIEYFWDFGDGTTGYGSSVVHTYSFSSPSAVVALRVTDSKGNIARAILPMNLTSTLFNPATLSGLQVWCRPESLGANGTVVSAWTNEGNSGSNLTQGTTANQPTVATGVIDGLSAVLFDGANDYLGTTLAADITRTVFLVAKQAAGSAGDAWLMQFGSANAIVRSNAGASWTWNRNQALADVTIGGTTTNWNLIELKFTSTAQMDTWLNSASHQTFDPDDSFNTTNIQIGANASGSGTQPFHGWVAEMLVYDSALSDADRGKVEGYLSHKYPSLGSFGTSTIPKDPPTPTTRYLTLKPTVTTSPQVTPVFIP